MDVVCEYVSGLRVFAAQDEREQPYNRQVFTLRNLQRSMDPLLAAQVYNSRQSSLGRLPEKLLLIVLHYLEDDLLALYCLQRVSGTFRLLIYEPSIWKLVPPSHVSIHIESPSSLPEAS